MCVFYVCMCIFKWMCTCIYIYYLLAVPSYLSSDILVCFIFMYPIYILLCFNHSSLAKSAQLSPSTTFCIIWNVRYPSVGWKEEVSVMECADLEPVIYSGGATKNTSFDKCGSSSVFFFIECRLKLYTSYNYQRIMIIITAFVIVFDAVIIISLFAYIKKRVMSSQGMPSKGLIY